VGQAVIEEEAAAVLVSLLTSHDQSSAFRFLLRRQTEAPYAGCWMTEGVFVLTTEELASPGAPTSPFPKVLDPEPGDSPAVGPPLETRID
jgi:hypothetical protein